MIIIIYWGRMRKQASKLWQELVSHRTGDTSTAIVWWGWANGVLWCIVRQMTLPLTDLSLLIIDSPILALVLMSLFHRSCSPLINNHFGWIQYMRHVVGTQRLFVVGGWFLREQFSLVLICLHGIEARSRAEV